MTARWMVVAVSTVGAVGVAMLLAQLSSPEREARSAFNRRFPKDEFELRFEQQQFRGVVCGHYRARAKSETNSWGSFVYVSHYSTGSPPASMLTLDKDAAGREWLTRYGCP